jgi:hypothetical protein
MGIKRLGREADYLLLFSTKNGLKFEILIKAKGKQTEVREENDGKKREEKRKYIKERKMKK